MDNMIAEVKRVEQTLRYLALMAEQATEGIAVLDVNGVLRFVNRRWARIHGYEHKDELIGKSISIFHTDQQLKSDVICFMEESKQRDLLEGPIEHLRRDGTVFPTQTRIVALKDEQGKVGGFVVFVTDLSASRQTESLLRQQTAELNSAKEQLRYEMSKRRWAEDEMQKCRAQLEQRCAELTVANEELQRQMKERQRVENRLRQYSEEVGRKEADLAEAINKVIQFAASGSGLLCHET